MDLDAGDGARHAGEHARRDRDAGVERVGDAVQQQGVHARPGDEDLERGHAARGGIAGVRGRDVPAHLARDLPTVPRPIMSRVAQRAPPGPLSRLRPDNSVNGANGTNPEPSSTKAGANPS